MHDSIKLTKGCRTNTPRGILSRSRSWKIMKAIWAYIATTMVSVRLDYYQGDEEGQEWCHGLEKFYGNLISLEAHNLVKKGNGHEYVECREVAV